MEEDRNQIAVYSRKSKFTGKGESIENQIELCRKYIRVHFGAKEAENALVYEDEGFSGGTLERPCFKSMMKDAREGKLSSIIVYRLDRISRNIGDFAKLIEELNEMGISFVSIKEQFDTASPMGRAMMYIASVFSQLERETIAERIRDNMHELAKTGRWLGGTTPTGYKSESISNVTIDGKVKKACRLKLIPEEAGIVALLFQKFLETGSLTKTETFLLQNGYTTKNGNRFSRFSIKGILSNPVYLIADREAYDYLTQNEVELFSRKEEFDGKHGIMAYNRTIQKAGRAHQIRERKEWIVSVGKHRGLIPGTVWVKVQDLLEQNKSKSYRKPRSNVALLSGLLFCASCGGYMRPKLARRVNEEGEQIYTYLCLMKEKSRMQCCSMKNVNGNLLDKVIMGEIKKLPEDGRVFLKQLRQGKKELAVSQTEYEADMARLRERLEEAEKEIRGLVTSLGKAAGSSAEDYIMGQISKLHEAREGLKNRIHELEELTSGHALSGMEFDLICQLLSTTRDSIDQMSLEQKREAVRSVVKKVTWDGKSIQIYLFGAEGGCGLPKGGGKPLREDSK